MNASTSPGTVFYPHPKPTHSFFLFFKMMPYPIVMNSGGGGKRYDPAKKYYKRKYFKVQKKYKREHRQVMNLRRLKRYLLTKPEGGPLRSAMWGPTWEAVKAANEGDQADPTLYAKKLMRKSMKYYGTGDYLTDLGKWGSRGLGGIIGGMVGGAKGAATGWNYGGRFSKWMGWGDYKGYGGDAGGNQIMAGSTETPMTVNQNPNDLSGDIYISHREFIGNVVATGGVGNVSPFNIQKYPINPGLSESFPWLSQIAQNYELYELCGTIYQYRPTAGELGATGSNALGKTIMATNYDADAPDFLSSIQMENYNYATACKPSEWMEHGVETARGQRLSNMLYVRTGVSSKDKVLTDVGNFYIATEGLPVTNGTTANVGELWVTYFVRLSRAQLYQAIGAGNKLDVHYGAQSSTNTGGNSVTFGLTQSIAPQYNFVGVPANGFVPALINSINCQVIGTGANGIRVIFPVSISYGVYRIMVHAQAAGVTATFWNAPSSLTNCVGTLLKPLGFGGIGTPDVVSTNLTTWTSQFQDIRINAPGSLQARIDFQYQVNNLPVNSSFYVQIMQMNQDLFI